MLEQAWRASDTLPRFISFRPGRATRYLAAVTLTCLAATLRVMIGPTEAGLPFLTFFPAAALSAILGGIGPGLLSTALGAALAVNMFTPEADMGVVAWGVVVFVFDAVLVSLAIEAMHRYYRRYQVMADELGEAREEAEAHRAEAEQANRAKSEFVAAMSHELRTPLNAIIGFSDAILSDVLHERMPDRYGEYVAHIHESGRHLLELINDLIDLSAIEAGRMELHCEPVQTAEVVEAAIRLVGPRAENKRLRLLIDLSDGPSELMVDARRLKQVLVNLLGNAVKFTPGRGRISLRSESLEDGGVRFLVADTGIGMDAEGIAKALSAYGQVDNSISRGEGSGLGLPLSARLTEGMGGRLSIESSPAVGTTVCVALPAACVAAQPGQAPLLMASRQQAYVG